MAHKPLAKELESAMEQQPGFGFRDLWQHKFQASPPHLVKERGTSEGQLPSCLCDDSALNMERQVPGC